jgi:hypothetical protein
MSLYHYTSIGYFFNGRINRSNFFLRRIRPFRNVSNFAMFDVLGIFLDKNYKFSPSPRRFRKDSILRDALFESQEFRHSFAFELV